MSSQQSKSFEYSKQNQSQNNLFHNNRDMREARPSEPKVEIEFSFILKKILL